MQQSNIEKKKIDTLRIIILVISLLLAIASIAILLYFFITKNDPYNRTMSALSSCALFLAPFILELIFRRKFSNAILCVYIFHVTISCFVGSLLSVYYTFLVYDKIVHCIFGYVGCIIGLFFVCKLSNVYELKPAFVMLIVFSVSLMFGAVWELFEYISDNLFNQTMQGVPVETINGDYVVSIQDTIMDLFCNFGGAIVFVLHYLLSTLTKKDLLIKSMTNDFSHPFVKLNQPKTYFYIENKQNQTRLL